MPVLYQTCTNQAGLDVRRRDDALAFVIERHDAIHVSGDVAVFAIRFNGVKVFADVLGVEHCSSLTLSTNIRLANYQTGNSRVMFGIGCS